MPFIITEPQKIEGTNLGYAVYPYQFSFDDHIDFSQKYDQKLMIFQLKNSNFIEIDKILHEEHYVFNDVHRGYVEKILNNYVMQNPQHITDPQKASTYMANMLMSSGVVSGTFPEK